MAGWLELVICYVTMAEAERMITILAEEDRVAIEELGEPFIETW